MIETLVTVLAVSALLACTAVVIALAGFFVVLFVALTWSMWDDFK